MKALVLTNMYPAGGHDALGIFIHQQNRFLLQSGVQFEVLCPIPLFRSFWKKGGRFNDVPSSATIDGIRVHYPRYVPFPVKPLYVLNILSITISCIYAVLRHLRKWKADVIHAYAATPAGFAALMLARLMRIPVVVSLRGSDIHSYPLRGRLSRRLTREVIEKADSVYAVSEMLKSDALLLLKNKETRVGVIYNGCDTEKFFPSEELRSEYRGRLGYDESDLVLLFVGHLLVEKGVYTLLDILCRLDVRSKRTSLVMIGKGREQGELSRQIRLRNLENRVRLLGNRSHEEMNGWLNACDLFLFPTRREGMPNVVLEAMACGKPVVGSDAGGIPEVVESGRNGYVVGSLDIDGYVEAIRKILLDGERSRMMSENNRIRIGSGFSWKRNCEKVLSIYREMACTGTGSQGIQPPGR